MRMRTRAGRSLANTRWRIAKGKKSTPEELSIKLVFHLFLLFYTKMNDDNEEEKIPKNTDQDSGLLNLLKQNQSEQFQLMTSRIESSLDKLTNITTTVFNASVSRKRKSDDLSCEAGPSGVMKIARLSHRGDQIESLKKAALKTTESAFQTHTDNEDKKAVDHGEDFLDDIEADLCITEEKGDTIHPKLARIVNSLFANKLSDEKLKDRIEKQPTPENCTNSNVAKCNPEIWRNLPHAKKLQDISIQNNINVVKKAAAALANSRSSLIKSKTSEIGTGQINDMLSTAADAITLLGLVSQDLHQIRRDNIRPNGKWARANGTRTQFQKTGTPARGALSLERGVLTKNRANFSKKRGTIKH